MSIGNVMKKATSRKTKVIKKSRLWADAMDGQTFDTDFEQPQTVKLVQTIELQNAKGEKYNKRIHCELEVTHSNFIKVIKLFNPKKIKWNIWEPPSDEDVAKYGDKAFGGWVPFDNEQLRLS